MFAWLRQRRWQFSMRFLLGLMLILAVGAALYGNHLRALERQERAFEQLSAKGFTIYLYSEGTYVRPGNPSQLICGTGLERVISASSSPKPFTDNDITVLDDIRNLCAVTVSGTNLTPEAIAHIKHKHPHCHVD
jgi:hypothetical protein